MTDSRYESDRLHSLRRRYRGIEAPRNLTAAILLGAEKSVAPAQVVRWPWLTAGAVAAFAIILIVPLYLAEEPGLPAKKSDLKVPALSVLEGRVPSLPATTMPALSSLRTFPLVHTIPSIPSRAGKPEASPQSITPLDHELTMTLQTEVGDDEQAQI